MAIVTCKAPAAPLSLHDEQILSTLLGSEQFGDVSPATQIDTRLPPDQHVPTEEVEQLVELEKEAIRKATQGDVPAGIALLNKIISREPKYASAYNNRAQMQRIVSPDSALSKAVTGDLESAIALALPEKSGTTISKMQASVLRNAYSQFAAIYLEQSRSPENSDLAWKLQLRASDMMVEASNYGEKIAATLAVHVNPYAKLCGNMMEKVLSVYR